MKLIKFNLFPDGKTKALTMSYDDGPKNDRRLVKLFNDHGIRGTFHLNSGLFEQEGHIRPDEVAELYKGHEVACHGVHHYDLCTLPPDLLVAEIRENRRDLERMVGYPVRGMSYPFGTYNDEVVRALSYLGIEYSRAVETTGRFWLDTDFLRWKGTCHHDDKLLENGRKFLDRKTGWSYNLMYVWGHSFEFERNNNWNVIEEFCSLMGGREDIWYATNIEIVDYLKASKKLRFTVDGDLVVNPSMMDVYISVDDSPVIIPAGQSIKL